MLVHSRLLALCGVLSLFCFSTTYAECAFDRAEITVQVKMGWVGKSEAVARSFITRELRALGDVVLVESNPMYTVEVVGVDDETNDGRITGYSLSFVALSMFPIETLNTCVPDPDYRALLVEHLRNYGRIMNHRLASGPPENLQSACVELIAYFDTNVLGPCRAARDRSTAPVGNQ